MLARRRGDATPPHPFRKGRVSHMKAVERIVGYRRDTAGVNHPVKAQELPLFPERWSVHASP